MTRFRLMPPYWFQLLRWRKYVSPKHWYPPTRLLGVISWRIHSMNLHCSENLKCVGEETFYWNAACIFWFLAWLTLRSWRWRRCVPPKRRTSSELHGVTTQKTVLFNHNLCQWQNIASCQIVRSQFSSVWAFYSDVPEHFGWWVLNPRIVHMTNVCMCGERVNLSCKRPWRLIGLWDVEAPTFSGHWAHRWWWGVTRPKWRVITTYLHGRVDAALTMYSRLPG
jgi:hypothetical protein